MQSKLFSEMSLQLIVSDSDENGEGFKVKGVSAVTDLPGRRRGPYTVHTRRLSVRLVETPALTERESPI